jgi:hypothetical protein
MNKIEIAVAKAILEILCTAKLLTADETAAVLTRI